VYWRPQTRVPACPRAVGQACGRSARGSGRGAPTEPAHAAQAEAHILRRCRSRLGSNGAQRWTSWAKRTRPSRCAYTGTGCDVTLLAAGSAPARGPSRAAPRVVLSERPERPASSTTRERPFAAREPSAPIWAKQRPGSCQRSRAVLENRVVRACSPTRSLPRRKQQRVA
jgi:hypothetical protein